MKFFYEKFWVPVFGYILSKFVFLIEGEKQDSKKKIRLITFTGNSKKNSLISLNKDGHNFYVDHKGYNIVECIHSIYILSLVDSCVGKSVYKISKS